MSRIYEALQKAEAERDPEKRRDRGTEKPATDRDSGPTNQPPQAETAAPAPVFSAPAAVAEPEYELPAISAQARAARFAPVAPAAVPVSDRLDLNAVPRRPWSPAFDHLPALLERGPAVEQFRSLRSRIFELRDAAPLKSILISSGMPQEGKSFVSSNLALSLARHKNSKVLLIDGDMRRYTMHQILGCDSQPGLADYLAGKVGMTEILQRAEPLPDAVASKQPALPNLTFIAGGNGGDRAADLSGSPRFGELLDRAAPHFDW